MIDGRRLRLPDRQARAVLALAAAVWLATLVGRVAVFRFPSLPSGGGGTGGPVPGGPPPVAPSPAAASSVALALTLVATVLCAGGAVAWRFVVVARRRGPGDAPLDRRGRPLGRVVVVASALTAALVSGVASAGREVATLRAPAPSGPVHLAGRAVDDVRPSRTGPWFLLEISGRRSRTGWEAAAGPVVLVTSSKDQEVAAGDRVVVEGRASGRSGRARGDPYAGTIVARRVEVLAGPGGPAFRLAASLRDRVTAGLAEHPDSPAALVAGFLIGDVRRLDPVDSEAMRKAGLNHFVAVSGSNVVWFLALWWVVVWPLSLGPRRRAVGGVAGLVLFVIVTRWEPSVVRAATMAALLLVGRAMGVPLEAFRALGLAVIGSLLISGELAVDVGFQLSVAATLGVLIGAGMLRWRRFRPVATVLGAAVAAQAAVAPLLIVHFGAIPLVSPLANVVAAPLVLVATLAGGVGLLAGAAPLVGVAVGAGEGVLAVARAAEPWPQLDPAGAVAAGIVALAAVWRPTRPVAILAATLAAAALALPGSAGVRPALVVLDVGQGDAVLVLGRQGTILVDGGPDPALLISRLRDYDVRRIDLMVLSHPHLDHVGGLSAALERVSVGTLWHPGFEDGGEHFDEMLTTAARVGVPVRVPQPGWEARVGDLAVSVIGPLRRYASPNDQSIVMSVAVDGMDVLLPGDIETIAQRELGPRPHDVLKVPHQGAATSDLGWLAASAGAVAVVSVGPNSFGHPSQAVLDALRDAGALVRRTDLDGDVVVRPSEVIGGRVAADPVSASPGP